MCMSVERCMYTRIAKYKYWAGMSYVSDLFYFMQYKESICNTLRFASPDK